MHILAHFLTPKPRNPRVPLDAKLTGARVVLRMAMPSDWRAWRALRDVSRDFLQPWEPEWPPNGLSGTFFEGLLRRQAGEWRQGKAYAFLIFLNDKDGAERREPPHQENLSELRSATFAKIFYPLPQGERNMKLVGGIGLNDIRRGIAQKGTLGYWIGQPYAGQGLMTEAAGLVCDFAFQTLRLHRVEASCLPNNEPSRRLLQRLGFAEEGYAKSYLRIDGAWQDHVLWGKTAP